MAIFNKSDQQADYSSNITTIAAGSQITGKIDIQCELHVDGHVDAEIVSTGTVKIGRTGVVAGNLAAKNLVITGKFNGEADCDSIEIIAGGEAEGRLKSVTLTIDAESAFQGESIRKQPGDSKVVTLAGSESTLEKALSDDSAKS